MTPTISIVRRRPIIKLSRTPPQAYDAPEPDDRALSDAARACAQDRFAKAIIRRSPSDVDQTRTDGRRPATQRYAPRSRVTRPAGNVRNDARTRASIRSAGNYPIARTTQDDELDADFFGDEEDFDIEDEERAAGGQRS